MLDIAIFLFLIFMTFRILHTFYNERTIFNELGLSTNLGLTSILFPFGPIALFALAARLGWIPAVAIAFFCFIPALVISRAQGKSLERSGTDRAQPAIKAVNMVFSTALVGFLYIAFSLIFMLASSSVSDY